VSPFPEAVAQLGRVSGLKRLRVSLRERGHRTSTHSYPCRSAALLSVSGAVIRIH
jgi:hypothetical protein